MLSEQALAEIVQHAEEGYPEEVCGVVVGKAADPSAVVVRRVANLANEYHRQDPVRYPRDARTAYIMDPKELLRIEQEADENGLTVMVIYHSHADHEAYFSATDRELALFQGEPLWPDVRYLVLSVKNKKVADFKMFKWDKLIKDFTEEEVAIARR
jgi:proteasome lid subunit RPN8/RPN11